MDLSKFPRRIYTKGATAIEPMPVLSKALGGDVNLWVKRDDLLGLTGGGNKTRKLEFVMADVLLQGADTIVTCGAVQSNHCRLTLSACIKEGLKCILIVEERVPDSYQETAGGNNYLFRLMGAEQIIPVGLGEAPAMVGKVAAEMRAKGRKVYCIPGGASNEIGALGYCACAAEIQVCIYMCCCWDYDIVKPGSHGHLFLLYSHLFA
jgi:D-cysteine desulfhydrase